MTPPDTPEHLEITTRDGWRLAVRHYPAAGTPWAAAWLGHAMMVDGRTYERGKTPFARDLADAGIETYVVDHRGHGRSRIDPARDRQVSYDDITFGDIPAITAMLLERHRSLPAVGIGHSLAGHALLAWLGSRPDPAAEPALSAAVTLASNVWMPQLEPRLLRRTVKRVTMALFRAIALVLGRYPARALRQGTDDVPGAFVRQLAAFQLRGRWGTRDGRVDYLAGLSRVRAPVLALVGAGDRLLSHPEGWKRFNAPLPRCEMRVVGTATGLPYDPGHMDLVIQDRCRPLRMEIVSWLREVLQPESAPAPGPAQPESAPPAPGSVLP